MRAGEVLAPVVDGGRRAEREAALRLLGAAHGDVAGLAGLAQEHDRGRPDAAAAAVHQGAVRRVPSAPRPGMKRFENAVRKTSGNAPASSSLMSSGTGSTEPWWTQTSSA